MTSNTKQDIKSPVTKEIKCHLHRPFKAQLQQTFDNEVKVKPETRGADNKLLINGCSEYSNDPRQYFKHEPVCAVHTQS